MLVALAIVLFAVLLKMNRCWSQLSSEPLQNLDSFLAKSLLFFVSQTAGAVGMGRFFRSQIFLPNNIVSQALTM